MKVDNLEDIYELSPTQLGMLFHSLLAPESGVYVQQFCFGLTGDLNVPAFQQAWQAVVERHSVLRTAFFWEELEKPVQVVYQTADLPLVFEDCRGMSEAEVEARVQALLQEERRQGFDLQEAPVMHLRLLQTGEQAYQFLWSHHHIVVDGWSAGLLFKEVLTFYHGYSQGRGVYLEPSRPYGDYLAWLQEQSLEEAEAFWRESLRGFTAPNSLRVGRVRQEADGHAGDEVGHETVGIRLTSAQSEALQAFARQQHVTVNTVVQGAWGLLVSRYSGEEDVMFGVTVSGRSDVLEGAESMIGLFINTLPLRMQVPADESVATWLLQLQARQVEMRKYEYTPLVEIQGWSDVPQGTSMFESILVFENYPMDEMLLGGDMGLNISVHAALEQTNYPLTLMVIPGDEMQLKITFDRDSYDAATAMRLVEQLGLLLDAMVEHPQRLLGELSILTEAERRQVLVEWNETTLAVETGRCVHELFAEQAARTPDTVALVVEDREMTFGELNRRANQVAHRLQKMGVGPDVLVGLCMERTFEMIVGLLGIMKAGGAYVPLDPEYPADRIAFILEDAKAPVLLTQPHVAERLPKQDASVLLIDGEWESVAGEIEDDPSGAVTETNLAYVIYTSGSTGKPKGVLVEHTQVTNFFAAVDQHVQVDGRDVMLAVTSMCFDISVLELFWTLTRGVKVVLLRSTEDVSAYGLRAQATKQQATLLQCTPSLLKMLSGETFAALKSLRALILGGEALSVAQASMVRQTLPRTRLLNFYGPTEATVWATGYEVTEVGSRIPIGRPFANVQAYILDANLQPVPVGVPGELHIGGKGIARGYHRRPELTEERFLANPFAVAYVDGAGDRLYKTGDLARFLPDGTIEYLGRIDHQVKIRGYRIELGEIETALAAHTGVREAVVVAREDIPGMPQLVAYVVNEADRKLTTEDVRLFLARSLPDYMVPSLFVFLEKMPLTPNGKVDRKALPAPDRAHMERLKAYVAPRNPVEEMLTGIWSDVLHVEQVGVFDNFFELGGHSILATQVVSRISSAFQVQVPLSQFFAKPTVADLAVTIERAGDMGQGVQAPPIQAVERGEHPTLSFAQERFWFIEQLNPGTNAYNIPEVVRLIGPLNVRAMERAFEEVVRRHESLRTRFRNVGGKPQQVIDAPQPFKMPIIDLSDLDEAVREDEALAMANEMAVAPFDLATGPMLRVTLLKLAEQDHLIVPVFHHIITDGWSMGVFFREIEAHYMAFADGAEESPLPDMELQYADFAHWQRDWLRGEAIEKQMDYWRERLGGQLPVLQLPYDRPRPAVQGTKGANLGFHFPPALSEKLSHLNRQEGVTMYMTLLAAFKTLLHRYSGQDDILVGTPIANRNREEVEKLIGVFVNTIVMRSDLSGEPTFRDLLHQVRKSALDAYANQDVPFEKLVEELAPDRNLSHSPIFQVMFVMQNAPMSSLQLPGITLEVAGLTLTRVGVKKAAAKYDLSINILESEQGMVGMMEYNTDLFDEATIARMVEHLQVLLEGAVEDPDLPLQELPLLNEAERVQVVEEWNRTEVALEQPGATVAQLFEAQVARTPQSQALVFEERSLTFAELNARANQVAHRLQKAGVGPDVLVGLCMERSQEMVVGMLGILKAGGAYVPIDPEYPEDRIAFLLEDAAVPVLLTQPHLVEHLPPQSAEVVVLDSEWTSMAGESIDNPPQAATSENLAYVIYTSGSTGKPKGVLVEHRQVVHLFAGYQEWLAAEESDTMLAVTSMCFDISVTELFWTLVNGVKVVLMRSMVEASAYDLATQAVQHQSTLMQCTPSLLKMLNEETLTALRSLRALILGGEALSAAQAKAIRTALPTTRLLNFYGPTETTVWATGYEVVDVPPMIPIGRPFANVQAYILDAHLQPVPIGVPGELYIGGAGVTRGYLRRPELTEERFLHDPFADDADARLYKTGDLARFLPDGNIEYLGRLDHQVKLRGFRIELGEVEAVLAEHAGVREVVVLAREDHPGDHRLVAYVVTDGSEVSSDELRTLAAERLPEYMVPSAFVLLAAMPLTPNGKVDRKALPAPEQELQEVQADFAAPRNDVEQEVATIYAELLHRQPVGIHDNFFEMGGHSLLATQLVSRVQAQFGVELQVRDAFEHRTVASLAVVIEQRKQQAGNEAQPNVPQLKAVSRGSRVAKPSTVEANDTTPATAPAAPVIPRLPQQETYELSHAQERIWFATQLNDAANEGGNFSILLQGALDVAGFQAAVRALGERHGILRTTFGEQDGKPYQKVHADRALTCEYIDLSDLDEASRKRALAEHAYAEKERRFDLRTGPLFRLTLYKLEAEQYLFVINAHHIAYDGWSIDVFMDDLCHLYLLQAQGRSASELPPALQYVDFAAWHNERLRSGALDNQREYWLYHLEGVSEPPTLPYDEASAAAAEPASNLSLTLDPDTSAKLRDLALAAEATVYMVALSAMNIWLSLLSEQTDITIGSPLSGRNRAELEGLVGVLINPAAMRTDLTGNPSGRQVIERVKSVAFDAYANQDYPFDQVVQALRSQGTANLYNTVLIGQNAYRSQLQLGGLTFKAAPLDELLGETNSQAQAMLEDPTVEFDLVLELHDAADGITINAFPNARRFAKSSFERLIEQFRYVLEQLAVNPQQRLSQLELPVGEDDFADLF